MNLKNLKSSRFLRWVFRFRNRQGYNIHSPFAFNLVTGVIYENWNYYAYDSLLLKTGSIPSSLRLKDKRLLFRLVNAHEPRRGVLLGSQLEGVAEYMYAGREHCDWHQLASDQLKDLAPLVSGLGSLDFLYIDDPSDFERLASTLPSFGTDHTLFVIRQIHASEKTTAAWKNLLSDDRVRVTFDLFDFGLVFFEKRLNKEDYVINYL